MREAGLTVRTDAAANLIGRRAGRRDGPVPLLGSHLDTVPGGGRFDGIAGVVAGLEIIRAVAELAIPCCRLPSGAGHDASHLAWIAPTGMLFVPSRGGRSHCPEEWTDLPDLVSGVRALAGTLRRLDRQPPEFGVR